jgi:hypothetical protein
MWRRVVLYVCSNHKIRPIHSGFSDVTLYLNACRRLEIWTVDIDRNCILWILCTPWLLFSGHSELLPRIKTAGARSWPLLRSTEIMNAFTPSQPLWLDGQYFTSCIESRKMWGENSCGHFLAELCNLSTVSLDSKSVSGVHKPHTLPLISLALCGDIWLTVWISVLEFVNRPYLFLTNCTSGFCFREVFTDAVRPPWYTLPNVYVTKRSPNIFACWPNLDSLTTGRQYHRNNDSYIINYIYSVR